MEYQNNHDTKCPESLYLELLVLDIGLKKEDRKRLQLHLQQCNKCRKTSKNIDSFYNNLLQELKKPVSNKTIAFCHNVSDNLEYGLIICDPIPEKSNGHGKPYLANLFFYDKGEKGKKNLLEYDMSCISKNQIALRIIADHDSKIVSLYLFKFDNYPYDDYILFLPGTNASIKFNSVGAAKLPFFNVEKLHQKSIFFDIDHIRSLKESRFSRLKKAILI
jgi:hypothetical protein